MTPVMLMAVAIPWLETYRGCERAQRGYCPKFECSTFRRDPELGQMLITYVKLSNKAPSAKSRLNGLHLQSCPEAG